MVGSRRRLGACIAITLAAIAIFGGMVAEAGAQSPPEFDQKAALASSQRAIGSVPADHGFTDSDGKRVRLSDFRGKPVVVNFIYTGCYQICPATTQFLMTAVRSARASLGQDSFQVLTVGFNLPFDHPIAMKSFAQRQGVASPGWSFLSPDATDLERLLQDFGFSYVQTPKGFDHVLQVTILDAEGRVYRQLYGESFDLPLLVAPLKDLLTGMRNAAPTLSDWVEKVRLLCTVYDPSAGRYRFNYAVLIEIFVGASVLLLGAASLMHEWRRRRSTQRRA